MSMKIYSKTNGTERTTNQYPWPRVQTLMCSHSSGLGFRVLCRSLVHASPRTECSSSISLPSTNVVGRNASNGWSRKNCFLSSSSKYATGTGFSAIAAGFLRERGRSNSERDGGARAGRGKGGCSSTAWNHAGSRFKYPALSRREACLCTWEATRLTIGGLGETEEDFAWQFPASSDPVPVPAQCVITVRTYLGHLHGLVLRQVVSHELKALATVLWPRVYWIANGKYPVDGDGIEPSRQITPFSFATLALGRACCT